MYEYECSAVSSAEAAICKVLVSWSTDSTHSFFRFAAVLESRLASAPSQFHVVDKSQGWKVIEG